MSMNYHLQQQGSKWVVVGTQDSGGSPHGGAAMPAAAHAWSGQPARRRRTGAAGGTGKMPSPEDLPPANKEMKRVAILGGGPAGAFAAEQLASAGLQVRLFDEKLAWEKPCGGGLTYKAYSQYPFLIDNPTPEAVRHARPCWPPRAPAR